MCILKKSEILRLLETGELYISDLHEWQVRENGVDLTIGSRIAVLRGDCTIDLYKSTHSDIANCFEESEIGENGFVLEPGKMYLMHTSEYVRLGEGVVGLANLKSTLARVGIVIPPTVIDAGFEGEVVIEVHTASRVKVYKGMPFLHMILVKADGEGSYREGGRYLKQRGITHAKPFRYRK